VTAGSERAGRRGFVGALALQSIAKLPVGDDAIRDAYAAAGRLATTAATLSNGVGRVCCARSCSHAVRRSPWMKTT
jgi:hypothetical protein